MDGTCGPIEVGLKIKFDYLYMIDIAKQRIKRKYLRFSPPISFTTGGQRANPLSAKKIKLKEEKK